MCGISVLTRDSRKLFCCLLPALQVVLAVKNPPANSGDVRDISSISESGRSSGGGHGNPLQYSCLENPMDRGAWDGLQSTKSHRVRYNWSDSAPHAQVLSQSSQGLLPSVSAFHINTRCSLIPHSFSDPEPWPLLATPASTLSYTCLISGLSNIVCLSSGLPGRRAEWQEQFYFYF